MQPFLTYSASFKLTCLNGHKKTAAPSLTSQWRLTPVFFTPQGGNDNAGPVWGQPEQ
jgi:hypothetical protein